MTMSVGHASIHARAEHDEKRPPSEQSGNASMRQHAVLLLSSRPCNIVPDIHLGGERTVTTVGAGLLGSDGYA
jgi:hypothetical protein